MFRRLILLTILSLTALCVNAQWVRSAKSRAFTRANAIAADGAGSVYTAGSMTCVTSFAGDSLRNNSCSELNSPGFPSPRIDMFLSKHDENGNLIWVNQYLGGQGNKLFVNDIGLDAAGNCYVTGAFTDSLIFNATTQLYNADTTTELFLAKIRPDGTTDWVVSYPVNNISEVASQKLSVASNAVYIAGYARGNFQIGAFADSVGRNASFVSSFDLNGASLWTKCFKEINATGSSIGKAIAVNGDSLWVFSSFVDSALVENDTIVPPDGFTEGGIVILYDEAGNLLDSAITSTPYIEGIKFHRPDGSLYLTGSFFNTMVLDGDTLLSTVGFQGFVSSHDADFGLNWIDPINAGPVSLTTGLDIDVSTDGSILAAGRFDGPLINGPSTTANGGGAQSGFVIKLDAAGNDEWLQTFGGTGDDAVVSVSSPDDDRVFVSGYFNRYVRSAGDEILAPQGSSNGFMARVDICPQLIAEMLTPDTTRICELDTAIFQVSNNAAYTYQWFKDSVAIGGATSSSIPASQAGEYWASVMGAGCSKLTPRAKLYLNPLPETALQSFDPLENCMGDSVKISASQAQLQFEWFNGSSALAIPDTVREMTFFTDGDYHLRLTDTLSCVALTDTLHVRFHPYPPDVITPAAGRHLVCTGDSLLLQGDTATPGMKYAWRRNGILLPNDTLSFYYAKTSAIYTVDVSNPLAGCSTTSLPDTVAVLQSPVVDLDAGVGAICLGQSKTLVNSSIMGQTYQWTINGVDIPGATAYNYNATTTGLYRVRVRNIFCERLSDAFDLTVNPVPTAAITNPSNVMICQGTPHILHAQQAASYSYQWLLYNQPIAGSTQPDMNVVQTGDYSVMVTNQFSCAVTSAQSTAIVNLSPPASIAPQGPTTFCEGNSVQLRGNDGSNLSYKWFRNGVVLPGETQLNLQASTSGLYEVQVTNSNGCSRTSSGVTVTVVSIPIATLATSTGIHTICDRDSLLLLPTDNAAYTYNWFHNGHLLPAESTSQLYAKLAGEYQVIISQGDCRDTSNVVDLNVLSNPMPIIKRDVEFLSIALFGDIQWYHDGDPIAGANLQAILPDEDGLYTVRVINSLGCSALSDPFAMCLPIPELIKTEDVLRVSIAADAYRWEYGNIPIDGATGHEITAQQSGSYTAVVTSNDGCIMETYPVTVCIPFPFVTQDAFSGVLYAFPNPASSYQWYYEGELIPDGTTQVHIPDNAGSYTVMVTDHEGCTSSSEPFVVIPVTSLESELEAGVEVYPNPVVNQLTISKSGEIDRVSVFVVNSFGQQIQEVEMSDDIHKIDFTKESSGIYTIVIRRGNETRVMKVVKL